MQVTYIVEDCGPALHSDALEDSQQSKQDVIELRDPVVRTDPGLIAFIVLGTAFVSAGEVQLRLVKGFKIFQILKKTKTRDQKQASPRDLWWNSISMFT